MDVKKINSMFPFKKSIRGTVGLLTVIAGKGYFRITEILGVGRNSRGKCFTGSGMYSSGIQERVGAGMWHGCRQGCTDLSCKLTWQNEVHGGRMTVICLMKKSLASILLIAFLKNILGEV